MRHQPFKGAHRSVAAGQQTTGTDNVHRARHSHAQEHVVSHIMRRVAEYDNVTEVRLLLPHWQESHTGSSSLGPILVQQWADLGRRCGSVLVQIWADPGAAVG
jgi:hypothetical protein